MKYRKILLILAIATLSLTACKKEENPAPAKATAIEETKEETEPIVENDENMDTITNADRGAAQGEVINSETDVETSEGIPFEEGEYSEPPVQETENLSEYDARMQRFNEDMKKWYEAGIISEEEYKAAIEYEPDIPGSTEYTPSTSDEAFAQQYEENAAKAREEMSTNGQGDQRTDIQYGHAEVPDDLKGNILGN